MGFKLDLSASYFAPAKLAVLDADGKLQNNLFDVQFIRFDEKQMFDLQMKLNAGQLDDDSLLDKAMTGWRGVTDANDQVIAYTPEARRAVCSKAPGMRAALVAAYFASLEPKAAAHLSEKN